MSDVILDLRERLDRVERPRRVAVTAEFHPAASLIILFAI
jgi:hypothetical protein